MSGIRKEAQEKLSAVNKQIQTTHINLIHLSNLFKDIFPPSKGAKLFFEQSNQLPQLSEVAKAKTFTKKLELLENFCRKTVQNKQKLSEETKKLFSSELSKKQKKVSLKNNYDNAARNYYRYLDTLQKMLSILIENRQNKKHLLSTPNVDEDIEVLKKKADFLKTEVITFETSLHDTAKKLKVAIDCLYQQYKEAYDDAYGRSGIWRKVKSFFRQSDRFQDIEFLQNVSNHAKANDALRSQAMLLVHNKIVETEFFGANSRLKAILSRITQSEFQTNNNQLNDLKNFLENEKDIQLPSALSKYFDKHQDQYTLDNAYKIVPY